jgi:hypothetical protein
LLLAEALLENSETSDAVAEFNQEMVIWLEGNLRFGIEQGEVRSEVDPKVGAEFVIGAMRGLALQHLMRGSGANLREVREQVMQLIKQAFAAPGCRDDGRDG